MRILIIDVWFLSIFMCLITYKVGRDIVLTLAVAVDHLLSLAADIAGAPLPDMVDVEAGK